jgi:hypothetical protein
VSAGEVEVREEVGVKVGMEMVSEAMRKEEKSS